MTARLGLIVAIACLTLAACGSPDDAAPPRDPTTAEADALRDAAEMIEASPAPAPADSAEP